MKDALATPADSYSADNALHWKRNLVICVFGSFTTLVSLTLLLPFLPVYVEELGVKQNAAIVGWSGVAFGATFLGTGLTAPLWGYLSDRYGRKPMLVRAAVGMAIVMPLIGCAHNVYELTLLRFLAGIIGGYASSSTLLVATQTPKDKAGWALGILSTGALAGTLTGPLIGGLLPGLIGIRNTFFAGGAMIAVAAILTMVFVKEKFVPRPRLTGTSDLAGDKNLRLIVGAMFATAMLVLFANMSIEPIITVYLQDLHAERSEVVLDAGIVMAASALGSIIMAAPLGRLADRIGGWRVIRCDISTSRLATRCRTSPSRCHTPYTPSRCAFSTSRRCCSTRLAHTITFTFPVSSSMVRKSTPLAVPGRWRTVTMPQARASWPFAKSISTSGRQEALAPITAAAAAPADGGPA
jgi:MFS family permease